MKRIGLITSHINVRKGVTQYLNNKGYKVTDLPLVKVNYDEFHTIILVEPYALKGEYYSISQVWKSYLSVKAKNVKLLIAGFKQHVTHPNYINLLHNWEEWNIETQIEQGLSTEEEWNDYDSFKNGIDILQHIKLFFVGHNHYSIIDCITDVRGILDNAKIYYYGDEELNKKKRLFKQIWEETLYPGQDKIRHLTSRWAFYHPYFAILPFQQEIDKIQLDTFMEDLNQLMAGRKLLQEKELEQKEQAYQAQNLFERLGNVTRVLQRINQSYTNPESSGNILILDDDKSWHQRIKNTFVGFQFHSIYQPEHLGTALATFHPQIILLDLDFGPSPDQQLLGVDILTKLVEKHPKTPIVVVSSHQKKSIIEKTYKLGAAFYLAKPEFDLHEWNKLLLNILGGKKFELADIPAYSNQVWELSKPRVLVIEDDPEWYQERIQNLTNLYQFERVGTIGKAKEVIEKRGKEFHLIILDLYFRDENGNEKEKGLKFIDEVKQKLSNTPVIVMTKSGSDNIQVQALNKDIEWYLSKPQYNAKIWLLSIKNAVDKKELIDQQNAS